MSEYRKKLIEVALPLEAINRESAHEKSVPRKGHPATMHLWWARRPLVACRAVLFASLVDDPSSHPETFPTAEAQNKERQRLFEIIEELAKWENTTNEKILEIAREEIRRSTGGNLPPVLDPFCGGGSIPLEAQRLGLEAHASDLNPIAVLITKALIETPPKFANKPPVNPESRKKLDHSKRWQGAQGLAEDIRHYGKWMRDEAAKRIGHLYPKVRLSAERGSGEATVIAWIWTRTVKCPNPACGAQMPLVRSFWLSSKAGKRAWIEPVVDKIHKAVSFEIKTGNGEAPAGTVNRRGATCVVCGVPVPFNHVRAEGKAGRMGSELMAIVAEGRRGRLYLSPSKEQAATAKKAEPQWQPQADLPHNPRDFKTPNYGLRTFAELFTPRQLVTLTTFSDLAGEVRKIVADDARSSGMPDNGQGLGEGGSGASAYADAISTYLAFANDKLADWSSTICSWIHSIQGVRDTFARQAIPMVWDFVEINPLSDSVGNFWNHVQWTADGLGGVPIGSRSGVVQQLDATAAINGVTFPLICTDPPYYDNIGYADLSDFFYIWLRRSVGKIYPNLFSTLLTPKTGELIASPYRFGGSKDKAERFFEEGLGDAFAQMRKAQNIEFPMTLFYAFKQVEAEEGEDEIGVGDGSSSVASTGWETMLEGLLKAGFAITGTWPMHSERGARTIAVGKNALASSIVLVCRPKLESAALATRREFLNKLKVDLPEALKNLKQGNVAPVDLAQAAIGPGMAVFSQYSKVLEADGTPMTVRMALSLINQILDEVLAEQESEFDPDTRWALAWFEQFGMDEASFGVAETLSKAKNTAVNGLVDAGILAAKAGKVRLLKRSEMSTQWDPSTDQRLTVWEVTQHLIRALEEHGEAGAASLLRKLGSLGDVARDLAYRLFSLCERNKWAQEALAYNSLVIAWPEIARLAKSDKPREQQAELNL